MWINLAEMETGRLTGSNGVFRGYLDVWLSQVACRAHALTDHQRLMARPALRITVPPGSLRVVAERNF